MPSLPGHEGGEDVNSSDIKEEIARFESVHPSIYAMYDLIETLTDRHQAEMFRLQIAGVEDAFVNSQEWTLGHAVPQIKLGILGSVNSGKSALVHRYLTGTYLKDESPEGGRFKKEVVLNGMRSLLLIRDEGGAPDDQFSRWIDGAVFVFSLESEESFQVVCNYFERLDSFRDTHDLPIILVGTQDSTSDSNFRVIDDAKARRLANTLNKCHYYETCSAYGLNVERVFQDACVKIVQSRPDLSCLLSTNASQSQRFHQIQTFQQRVQPSHPMQPAFPVHVPSSSYGDRVMQPMSQIHSGTMSGVDPNLFSCMNAKLPLQCMHANTTTRGGNISHKLPPLPVDNGTNGSISTIVNSSALTPQSNDSRRLDMHNNPGFEPDFGDEPQGDAKDSLTPSSTPTQARKSRPKSNLFKKPDDSREKEKTADGIGSGRSIPIKQGYLYKRTCKPLNKEWKTKKYIALTDDARLIYHPNIQDYVQNSHGKEIDLSRVTIKIPGVTFRQTGGQTPSNGPARNHLTDMPTDQLPVSQENTVSGSLDTTLVINDSVLNAGSQIPPQRVLKDTSKKRSRRVKPSQKYSVADGYESEGYEFQLISMDRQWNFEAHSSEERDDWVAQIDRAIITRLQLLKSSGRRGAEIGFSGNSAGTSAVGHAGPEVPSSSWGGGSDLDGVARECEKAETLRVDEAMAKSLCAVAGNDVCADCGEPNPDWASLNLGEMVCIECSGVHRKLGTHISRIRSLMLDDWTPEAAAVMRAIGNTLANSVWEAAVPGNAASRRKPDSRSSKEEMEAWIQAKYEHREFLPPLPYPEAPLQQQLIDAIARQDTRQVILCLARATPDTVNAPYSRQDRRAAIHIAATLGNIVYLQLLLWYNGDPGVMDSEGRNAFYYAHCSYHFDCANFLVRNGCPRQSVPAPVLSHFSTAQQPLQQKQMKSPLPLSPPQSQTANCITAKHHPQQHLAYKQQMMGYRGSRVAASSVMPLSNQQGIMPGAFAPAYMNSMMPVVSSNAMLGAVGCGSTALNPATVTTGATIPRRRGPFDAGQGCYMPAQVPPAAVANSMANRPLPVAGAFDPNTGRPHVSSALPTPGLLKSGGGSGQEIGL